MVEGRKVTELKKGDDLGAGSIRRYTWKSTLPYRLRFDVETVRVEPMTVIEGIARGEPRAAGSGIYKTGRIRHARYDWSVDTTKPG
jgi:hypothetical protein